jgi:hypothetical protein
MSHFSISKRVLGSLALTIVNLLAGEYAMSLEQPDYTVIHEEDGVEYRQYAPYLVTETIVANQDSYKAAANEGFRRLFRYISGGNQSQSKVAMTKPVQQERSSKKIAMTAPVEYDRSGSGYRIAFMLPSEYTLDTAPVPLDSRLQIRAVAARTMAVVRYSGRWTQSNFIEYQEELLSALDQGEVNTRGEVRSAFYNAPFVPPFMRRNEVMIEVENMPLGYTQSTDSSVAYVN